jgi:hypothetical protein
MRDELSDLEVLRIAELAEHLDEVDRSESARHGAQPEASENKRTRAIRKRILEPRRVIRLLDGTIWSTAGIVLTAFLYAIAAPFPAYAIAVGVLSYGVYRILLATLISG